MMMLARHEAVLSIGSSSRLASTIWKSKDGPLTTNTTTTVSGARPPSPTSVFTPSPCYTPPPSSSSNPTQQQKTSTSPAQFLTRRAHADYTKLVSTLRTLRTRVMMTTDNNDDDHEENEDEDDGSIMRAGLPRLLCKYETFLRIACRSRDSRAQQLVLMDEEAARHACGEDTRCGGDAFDDEDVWLCRQDLAASLHWLEQHVVALQDVVLFLSRFAAGNRDCAQ